MTQGGRDVVQRSSTFGVNEASVLHNQSCGLVVDESLGEWQGRTEWAEEWCCTKPSMKPSTWMNEQWTTTTVCRAYAFVCVHAHVWREGDVVNSGSDVQRWGVRSWSLYLRACRAQTDVSLKSGRNTYVSVYVFVDVWVYVCVCGTLDSASVNSGLEEKLSHTCTPFRWAKSSLCFCFLPRQNTPQKIRPLFLKYFVISLQSLWLANQVTTSKRKEVRAPPLPSASTWCTRTA